MLCAAGNRLSHSPFRVYPTAASCLAYGWLHITAGVSWALFESLMRGLGCLLTKHVGDLQSFQAHEENNWAEERRNGVVFESLDTPQNDDGGCTVARFRFWIQVCFLLSGQFEPPGCETKPSCVRLRCAVTRNSRSSFKQFQSFNTRDVRDLTQNRSDQIWSDQI